MKRSSLFSFSVKECFFFLSPRHAHHYSTIPNEKGQQGDAVETIHKAGAPFSVFTPDAIHLDDEHNAKRASKAPRDPDRMARSNEPPIAAHHSTSNGNKAPNHRPIKIQNEKLQTTRKVSSTRGLIQRLVSLLNRHLPAKRSTFKNLCIAIVYPAQ